MSDAKRSERSHAYLLVGAAALKPMLPRVPPSVSFFSDGKVQKGLRNRGVLPNVPQEFASLWERELPTSRSLDREH